MIYPSKYNGIDFSGNFARESYRYDFDSQRIKNLLPSQTIQYLSFNVTDAVDITTSKLVVISSNGTATVSNSQRTIEGTIVYFSLVAVDLPVGEDVCFAISCDTLTIYSELYRIISSSSLATHEICTVTASNSDNRHGYLTKKAFGFFKVSKFKSDIFLNKKVEYKYSYSRSKILSSENQIGKRFTFQNLTMYNANLLRWLCNCETLTIDGINYQLISDFTELETDENTETMSLRAEFVEVEQSFFSKNTSSEIASDIFVNEFFMQQTTPIVKREKRIHDYTHDYTHN